MSEAPFVPAGVPQGILNLIQQQKLAGRILSGLIAKAFFRRDYDRVKLESGQGSTLTTNRLTHVAPDLTAAPAIGTPSVLNFNTEQFTARPNPYAMSVLIDAPSSYVQIGSQTQQKIGALTTWGGMLLSRLARKRTYEAAGYGRAMIRRSQTTGHSVLLVNSIGGFRYTWVDGVPTPVSASTPLGITIVAATTFTANVTGVTPLDANFPDGPGTLTLSTTLSAAVDASAGGAYCYRTSGAAYVVRPNNRASSDTLLNTDLPTMTEIRAMITKAVDLGIPRHEMTNSYHIHVPASFFEKIGADTAYRQATQGMGASTQLGPGAYFSPALGVTFIENNDSPGEGKAPTANVFQLGDATHTIGATGSVGSHKVLNEVGLDVRNFAGVKIERCVLTGGMMGEEVYIDEMKYLPMMGMQPIGKVTENVVAYSNGGPNFLAADLAGLRLTIVPPLDPRALVATVTLSCTLDMLAHTDVTSISDTTDTRPYKRTIMCEYGVPG